MSVIVIAIVITLIFRALDRSDFAATQRKSCVTICFCYLMISDVIVVIVNFILLFVIVFALIFCALDICAATPGGRNDALQSCVTKRK